MTNVSAINRRSNRLLGRLSLGVGLAVALAGCQQTTGVKALQDRNAELAASLQQAQATIENMRVEEQKLRQNNTELRRVMGVLDSEKSLRAEESSSLRGEVRRFVQRQIDQYKSFLLDSQLLDYVGSELVQRTQVEESPRLLVDMAHPIPANGTLTGVKGHFLGQGTFAVKVLRPVEDRLVVIWESKPLSVVQPGINNVNFSVAVGVEAGDYLAYLFPTTTFVSFDTGTGDTRYRTDDIRLGEMVKASSLRGESERRAYALGVYGLLN